MPNQNKRALSPMPEMSQKIKFLQDATPGQSVDTMKKNVFGDVGKLVHPVSEGSGSSRSSMIL